MQKAAVNHEKSFAVEEGREINKELVWDKEPRVFASLSFWKNSFVACV